MSSQKDAARLRLRADEKRQAVAAYKLSKGCIDCGYNENALALEFDRLPGTKKKRTMTRMVS